MIERERRAFQRADDASVRLPASIDTSGPAVCRPRDARATACHEAGALNARRAGVCVRDLRCPDHSEPESNLDDKLILPTEPGGGGGDGPFGIGQIRNRFGIEVELNKT
ncbi:hypothetical protein ParKJ_04935 [Paraburkholderia fungorum]|uniref:Uncharacterized protein n=1 Tax=Paraburkholderia fungorum TaxID=134537 RepID=A0AAP5Q3D3_9BURK|nr:hypothetical protein [Paraburkholderia fungorum]MDT8836746.1 hypothetical protein [Paraburkholderia fungorum]